MPGQVQDPPPAPLGPLSRLGPALAGAASVDEVADCVLRDLGAVPGVSRIGFALTEGGGRRLRFTASDREREDGAVTWCHIDAYDDVPLTRVVRSGESVTGTRESLAGQFADYLAGQPDHVRALAALPLPGVGAPIGGVVVFLDQAWEFSEPQRRLLETTAHRAAQAVRRVRRTAAVDDASLGADDAAEEAVDDAGLLTARVLLDDDLRSSGVARRFLRGFLRSGDVTGAVGSLADDLVDSAELCLSELVTNALVHATSRTEVRVDLDPVSVRLRVTVSDRGAGAPAYDVAPGVVPGASDPLRVHGRGLQLVEALADGWGSERRAGGTTVWFSLGLDPVADLPSSGPTSRSG